MTSDDQSEQTRNVQEKTMAACDLVWPDEDVIRFFAKTFRNVPKGERKNIHVMDLGFGTGRHLYYLGMEGYSLYGLDYTENALRKTRELLNQHGLHAELRCEDLGQTTFGEGRFDVMLAWGVLYLAPLVQIRRNMSHVARLIKKGGWFCGKFRTPNSWFYGLGTELEPYGYQLDARAGPYAGNYYYFFTKEKLVQFLESQGFEIVNLEYKEWHKGGDQKHSYWMVWARKR